MSDYRKRLHEKHITYMFGELHDLSKIESEYAMHDRYYAKNYGKYLPEDHAAWIADIGCGLGHFLHFLKENRYTNYIGVDISQEMVAFVRQKGFPVVQDDVVNFLKKNPNEFDCIVMNDLIVLLTKEEILEMLDTARNALKKGGVLLIKTTNIANAFLAPSSVYQTFTHETDFTEVSLREVLRACEFKEILILPTDIYIFYGNPINYLAKALAAAFSKILYLINWLYGRKTIKIFSKDILAIARK